MRSNYAIEVLSSRDVTGEVPPTQSAGAFVGKGRGDALPAEAIKAEVWRRLREIYRLPARWDSYQAKRVPPDTGAFAYQVLVEVLRPGTPMPAVVPTPSGGVQLDWHEKGIDVELHVMRPYCCELWYSDRQTGEELEAAITIDLSPLARPIELLSNR
jgi:hypothetical protein